MNLLRQILILFEQFFGFIHTVFVIVEIILHEYSLYKASSWWLRTLFASCDTWFTFMAYTGVLHNSLPYIALCNQTFRLHCLFCYFTFYISLVGPVSSNEIHCSTSSLWFESFPLSWVTLVVLTHVQLTNNHNRSNRP